MKLGPKPAAAAVDLAVVAEAGLVAVVAEGAVAGIVAAVVAAVAVAAASANTKIVQNKKTQASLRL